MAEASLSIFCSVDSSINANWSGLFPITVVDILSEIPVFNVSTVDPDQMSCYAATDLALFCFPKSQNGTLGNNVLSFKNEWKKGETKDA